MAFAPCIGAIVRSMACLLLLAACFGSRAAASGGETMFDVYTPLSSSTELARRLLSPLTYTKLHAHFSEVRDQPIDLEHERFFVRVPERAPAKGYGLLVFIPPWPQAKIPRGWASVLDRRGVIFVGAAGSGNEASVLDRRVPLALLAYANVRKRYPLDPDRIYVGGLSGGSRVALRVALGYPDVFSGALLNAGSDPLGEGHTPLPPPDLLGRFQASTRLVFVTGERDESNLERDIVTRASLKSWCVFNARTIDWRRHGHEILDPPALDDALAELDRPVEVDGGELSECRAGLDRALATSIAEVETAIGNGDRDRAARAIAAIDARFGGLAATAIADLEAKLGGHRAEK